MEDVLCGQLFFCMNEGFLSFKLSKVFLYKYIFLCFINFSDIFALMDLNCNCLISMRLSLKSDLISICQMSLKLILGLFHRNCSLNKVSMG